MNSNNYNSGTEINFDISNIESLYWIQEHETRLITLNHEKQYSSLDFSEGGFCSPSYNNGFVMSNYDAESRCRYLHNKYRKNTTKLGLVRTSDLVVPIKKETYISYSAIKWHDINPFSVKEMSEFQSSLWG